MNKNLIACCYFPTTVIFIDDRVSYLKSLTTNLPHDLLYKTYSDPHEALKFFQEEYNPNPCMRKITSHLKDMPVELGRELEEKELTHSYIDIDVAAIHQKVYSPDRFTEISVVIIDYQMPQINGIEFCEQLKNSQVKKLMITGEADYQLGVEALNAGIIEQYILKTETDFNIKLNKAIRKLQYQYFCDLPASPTQNLRACCTHCCLGDHAFIELFDKLRQKHNIVEYYLVNDSGCFLMLDKDGHPNWLAVKSEQDMERHCRSISENEGPQDMIDALEQRHKLLFLFTQKDEYVEHVKEWRKFMHPATKLIGQNNTYYYSYIKGPSVYDIHPKKIVSFDAK